MLQQTGSRDGLGANHRYTAEEHAGPSRLKILQGEESHPWNWPTKTLWIAIIPQWYFYKHIIKFNVKVDWLLDKATGNFATEARVMELDLICTALTEGLNNWASSLEASNFPDNFTSFCHGLWVTCGITSEGSTCNVTASAASTNLSTEAAGSDILQVLAAQLAPKGGKKSPAANGDEDMDKTLELFGEAAIRAWIWFIHIHTIYIYIICIFRLFSKRFL